MSNAAIVSTAVGAAWLALAVVLFATVALVRRRDRAMPHPPLDVEKMLDAIAWEESGNCWSKVGQLGERGRCQIMEHVWRLHTPHPFAALADHKSILGHEVERAHLSFLCGQLVKLRLHPTPELIAAAWRYGIGNAVRCSNTPHAVRVGQLYREALRK